jgi:hypothetical protein
MKHGDRIGRLRYPSILAGALGLALLAGWGIGSIQHNGGCSYSCPAPRPCPEPADCLPHFHWAAAVVAGLIVALLVGGAAILVHKRPKT